MLSSEYLVLRQYKSPWNYFSGTFDFVNCLSVIAFNHNDHNKSAFYGCCNRGQQKKSPKAWFTEQCLVNLQCNYK